MSKIFMGYTGIYRQPYPNQTTYGDTIYAITDDTHQEINIIMLTPGAYKDAYQIASKPTYRYVNIFVPTVDINYISDLYRLYMDLLNIKMHVKWYFPDKMSDLTKYVLFDLGHVPGHRFSSVNIPGVSIEFQESYATENAFGVKEALDDKINHKVYDICVCDGTHSVILSQYMDESKLKTLTRTGEYDEIHLPYHKPLYEGLDYTECCKLGNKYKSILFANSFRCREEYLECAEKGRPGYRIYLDVI